MERLRALAQQTSNGSYGADERESMQAEADEIIAEIARIRDTIQYNGMNLYETPRNEDIVTTSLNRLSASARVTNAGEIYPKKTNNDTQSSPAAFTPAVDEEDNTLASSSPVFPLSNDTIEGAVDFSANESKTINIDGVEYTITNRNARANSLSYSKDTVTGEITFLGGYFTITGQSDVEHNLIINGSYNYVYGGDLNDKIQDFNASSLSNRFYGQGGDDELTMTGQSGALYGGSGNDILTSSTGSRASGTMYGNDGDDILNIATATYGITYDGGNGNDVLNIYNSITTQVATITGSGGDDIFNIYGGNSLIVNGGEGDDVVNASSASYTSIYDSSGNNVLNSGNNVNLMVSGFGAADNSESLTLAAGETKVITINGIDYTITNNLSGENTFLYSYNTVSGAISMIGHQFNVVGETNKEHNLNIYGYDMEVSTGDFNDTVYVFASGSTINTNGGDDTADLNGIDITLHAGAGNDDIVVRNNYTSVYAEDGDDTLTTTNVNAPNRVLNGGNNVYNINTDNASISGSSGNDTFYINGDNNTVLGGSGDDYFVIDGDNNIIDGGTDNNYYIDNGS